MKFNYETCQQIQFLVISRPQGLVSFQWISSLVLNNIHSVH